MSHQDGLLGLLRGGTTKLRNWWNSRLHKQTPARGHGSDEPPNQQGLAIFPDELLLKILDEFPEYTPPTSKFVKAPAAVELHNQRREPIMALSQTCRTLRRFFLPYAWEYIELYRGLTISGQTLGWGGEGRNEKRYARALKRHLEIVTTDIPELAASVRCMDVTITDYDLNGTLQRLAEHIPLLPNLHTLKLYYIQEEIKISPARSVFRDHVFPQIQRLIIPVSFYPVMRCCTQARNIDSIDPCIDSRFFRYAGPCSQLENLIYPPGTPDLFAVQANHPNLRDIDFFIYFRQTFLPALLRFEHLRKIKISQSEPCDRFNERVVFPLLEHLRNLQDQDREEKRLWIRYTFTESDDVYLLSAPEEPTTTDA